MNRVIGRFVMATPPSGRSTTPWLNRAMPDSCGCGLTETTSNVCARSGAVSERQTASAARARIRLLFDGHAADDIGDDQLLHDIHAGDHLADHQKKANKPMHRRERDVDLAVGLPR